MLAGNGSDSFTAGIAVGPVPCDRSVALIVVGGLNTIMPSEPFISSSE